MKISDRNLLINHRGRGRDRNERGHRVHLDSSSTIQYLLLRYWDPSKSIHCTGVVVSAEELYGST